MGAISDGTAYSGSPLSGGSSYYNPNPTSNPGSGANYSFGGASPFNGDGGNTPAGFNTNVNYGQAQAGLNPTFPAVATGGTPASGGVGGSFNGGGNLWNTVQNTPLNSDPSAGVGANSTGQTVGPGPANTNTNVTGVSQPATNQWTVPTGPLAGTPFINGLSGNNPIGPFGTPPGGWSGENVLQGFMQNPGWVNSWVNPSSLALGANGLPQSSASQSLPQVQLMQQGLQSALSGTGGAPINFSPWGGVIPGSPASSANQISPYNLNGTAPSGGVLSGQTAQWGQGPVTGVTQGNANTNAPSATAQNQSANQYQQFMAALQSMLGGTGNTSQNNVVTTPLGYTQYQGTPQTSTSNLSSLLPLLMLFASMGQGNAASNNLVGNGLGL